MPMRSQRQRAFLWANHPEIAQRFEDETPKGAKLPERVSPKVSGSPRAPKLPSGLSKSPKPKGLPKSLAKPSARPSARPKM